MTERVAFLIDGLNVYHSMKAALSVGSVQHVKWLNYTTAVMRHRILIEALRLFGVEIVLGNFKAKRIVCQAECGLRFVTYEEKETDVNIAVRLLRLFIEDECDTVVIMSGDTDLVSAICTVKQIFPHKRIGVAFPYKRSNGHFRQVADFTFKISAERYQQYQLSDSLIGLEGKLITKPLQW